MSYIDSSVILRSLLGQPGAMPLPERGCTSVVTRLEARRLLFRLRGKDKLSDAELAAKLAALDELLGKFEMVPCDAAILEAAAIPLAAPLGALDAIHLASAMRAGASRMLTHNVELAIAGRALGLQVVTAP